ncbi:MAG: hypothetical protein AAF570_01885 [Bacteroidota bacterium]
MLQLHMMKNEKHPKHYRYSLELLFLSAFAIAALALSAAFL